MKAEPIGINCFPIRLDDGSYAVLGRRNGADAGGIRNDGEYTGNVAIAVSREKTGDVIRATRPTESTSGRVPFWVPAVSLSLSQDEGISQVNITYSFDEPGIYRNPYRITEFWLVILVDGVEITPSDFPDQLIEPGERGGDVIYPPYGGPTVTVEVSIYTDSSLSTLVATATETITPI